MKAIWTNADLTSTQRKAAISKAGLYTGPSVQNAMGKKAGKFGSKNWYGLTPQEEIDKMFGSYSDPDFKIDTATSNFKDGSSFSLVLTAIEICIAVGKTSFVD